MLRGLEAEFAVGGLAASLAAFFYLLLALEFEDGDDAALVNVAAGEAAGVDAVGVGLDEHRAAAAGAFGRGGDGHLGCSPWRDGGAAGADGASGLVVNSSTNSTL